MAASVKELEPYLDPEFSPVEYARLIVEKASSTNHGITESLNKLQNHKETVEAAIAAHISEHNEHLLERLSTSTKLKGSVKSIKSSTDALSVSLGRIQRDVSQPFAKMKAKALQMENMQNANDVLRRVLRFLSAVRKLKAQLNANKKADSDEKTEFVLPTSARDVARSAQVLHEVESLIDDHPPRDKSTGILVGIDIVDAERAWLLQVSSGIRSKAEAALRKAIQSLNQSEVGASLQAFHNLDYLAEAINDAISWAISVVAEDIRDALDLHALSSDLEEQSRELKREPGDQTPGKSDSDIQMKKSKSRSIKKKLVKPPAGMEDQWKKALWGRMEKLESNLRAWALRIWNLQRVLAKKRDPTTHICFADQVAAYALEKWKKDRSSIGDRPETVYQQYWRLVCEETQTQYERATKASPFIRTTLGVQYYPKLRRLMRIMLARIHQSTTNKSVPAVGGTASERRILLHSLTPFIALFLARSLSRLNEPVSMMFPEGRNASTVRSAQEGDTGGLTLPTKTDVLTFSKVISQEISAAQLDAELAVAVCKGVCKALSLFTSKAESLLIMDETAIQFRLYQPGMSISKRDGNVSAGTAKLAAAAVSASLRTKSQVHNIALLDLVVCLYDLAQRMPEETTKKLNESRKEVVGQDSYESVVQQKRTALKPAIRNIRSLIDLIMGEYLTAASSSLEQVLARMHRENFSSGDPTANKFISPDDSDDKDVTESSEYMDAFVDAVSVLCREHLDKLPNKYKVIQEFRRRLQARVIVLFVRNVCMIRPLDGKGRLRLVRDLTLFEEAIGPLAPYEKDEEDKVLDGPYKELRSLRRLLVLIPGQPETLQRYKELSTAGAKLSTVLLLVFASAPPELRSPHDQLKMSPERFGEWMDKVENGKEPNNMALLNSGVEVKRTLEDAMCKLCTAELDRYMQRLSAASKNTEKVDLADEYHILRNLI